MPVLDTIFDGIRPYYDSEIPASISRMRTFEYLNDISDFLQIEGGGNTMRSALDKCRTVDDFQDKIMAMVMDHVLSRTSAGVEYSGLGHFEQGQKHLILANHRDIVLDSAIIQLIFHRKGITTTEIAVGDNLITSQFIEDVARSNKMIKVTRSTSPREVYNSSLLLSKYIRHQITTESSSIWIAQRNGRTKDGYDLTEQGLLKMVQMSGEGDFVEDMDCLKIVPTAISYEFEPCDALKTREIFVSRRHPYVKAEGEDLNSIITGMKSWKGRIMICFTEPIQRSEIESCSSFAKNERFVELGKIIDRQIHSEYHLWPNNYAAEDILRERGGLEPAFRGKYGKAGMETFQIHMQEQLDALIAELSKEDNLGPVDEKEWRKELEDIFLHIYANPVKACLQAKV
ncbi:MAG: 1-acyl-sn-glycerol-3-phosphate acyltransferase [Bacteroidales bacterium]|nr:1-acyl-sn-glycerol-3-phosphate acyltransferase [Bacteroidales bacterium]